MKKKILCIFILLLCFNISFAQFLTEVPTPSGNALYSGCAAVTPNYYVYIWVCGATGTVYKGRSNFTSLNWLSGSGNLSSSLNLVTIAAIDSMTAFVGGNISTTAYIYKTTNGGTNWVQQFSQPNGRINAVWMRNALTGFAEGNPVGGRWSLFRTTNSGSSWDSTGRYLPAAGGEQGFNNSLWCIGDTVIFGTNNTRTYFSSNYGANWLVQSTGTETNIYSIYWDFWLFPSGQRMFAGSPGAFLNTSNFGANWLIQQNVPGTGNILGICSYTPGVDDYTDIYSRSNKIYQGTYTSGNWGLMHTAPAGNYTFLFQKRNEPPPRDQINAPIVGVRDNGGVSICFGCRWGGINRTESEIPNSFALYQNYPNPFNPTTKIKFAVPPSPQGEGLGVRVIVYDILGREIQTLVNKNLSPGTYEVDFEGSNLPSGVYYYSITAGEFTQTNRMVLIK